MEVDRLEVKVQAEATKANSELDKLISKLDQVTSSLRNTNSSGLANMAAGIQKLSTAMQQMKTVGSADFNRLSKNIQKLSTLDKTGIQKTATAIRDITNAIGKANGTTTGVSQLNELAKSISKLGGKSAQNAATNIPQISKALKQFMQEMSKAPNVSKNVVNMTNALAKLSSQGSKVKSAASSINSSLNSYSNQAKSATERTKTFASALAKLYASFWAIRKAAGYIGNSVETAMDYIETVDLFKVATSKVASNVDDSTWKKLGYDSALAYEQAFVSEISGFVENITDKIGIYDGDLMNYSAIFAQISNAMGNTTETAKNLSMSFTALGEDIASLWNMDVSTAMTKLQAGLTGQVRPLRELGIDITQASLQQTAYAYGIKDLVSDMSQAAKMQLRYLTIMEQSKVAWGNMALTIESPSNQLRILKERFKTLAKTVGAVFIPIVSKILPVVNAITIAITRMVQAFAALLGIEIEDYSGTVGYELDDSVLDVYDDLDDTTSGVADNTNDAADATKKAAAAAKEWKNQLLGFDEINKLTEQTSSDSSGSSNKNGSSGSGSGGGYSVLDDAIKGMTNDYLGIFNDKMNNISQSAEEMADSIINFFKKLKQAADPTLKSIQNLYNNGFKLLAKFTWDNLKSFFNNFLVPVGTWTLGEGLPRFFNVTNNLLTEINWSKLNSSLGKLYTALSKIAICTFDAALDFYEDFMKPIAVWTMNRAVPTLVDCLTNMANAINWDKLNGSLENLWQALSPFAISVGNGLLNFIKTMAQILTPVISATVDLFSVALDALATVINSIPTPVAEALGGAIGGIATALLVFKGMSAIGTIIGNIGTSIVGMISGIAMHPYMAIASGIAALAGAIISLCTSDSGTIEIMGQRFTGLSEGCKSACEEMQNLITESDEYVNDTGVAEYATIQKLADKYYTLAGKTNLTSSEQEELKEIVKQMVKIYPDLNKYVDEENGLLTIKRETLDKVCQSILKEAKAEAAREKIVELYKKQYEIEEKLADAQTELTDNTNKQKESYSKLSEVLSGTGLSVDGLTDKYNKNKVNIEELKKAIQDNVNISDSQKRKIIETAQEYNSLGSKVTTTENDIKAFDRQISQSNTTIDKFAQEIADAQTELDEVDASGVSKEIKSEASTWKTSFASGISTAIGTVTSKLNNDTTSKNATSSYFNKMKGVFNGAYGVFSGFGLNIVNGLNNGISRNGYTSSSVVTTWATKIKTAFTNFFGIHSPSRLLESFGGFLVEGLNIGIDDNVSSSEKTVDSWVNALNNSIGNLESPTMNMQLNTSGIKGYDTAIASTASIDTEVQRSVTVSSTIVNTLMDAITPLILSTKSDVNVMVNPNGKGIFDVVIEENDKELNQYGMSRLQNAF
jgi:uncharacterized coiled-coil DUF342 family protein